MGTSDPNRASSQDPRQSDAVEAPPVSLGGTLLRIGPGLIIAGNIVGSGELIATTAAGAEAGFWLLWLIILGCLVKVFTQVEFGRYTIIHGETSLHALNGVPGPRLRRRCAIRPMPAAVPLRPPRRPAFRTLSSSSLPGT